MPVAGGVLRCGRLQGNVPSDQRGGDSRRRASGEGIGWPSHPGVTTRRIDDTEVVLNALAGRPTTEKETAMTVPELLASASTAFNRMDIDGALAAMQPDVEWANGMEGGFVHGHDAVRAYWTRRWRIIDPDVEPVSFEEEPGHRASGCPGSLGPGRQRSGVTHRYMVLGLLPHRVVDRCRSRSTCR
jgi:hypothetical protein